MESGLLTNLKGRQEINPERWGSGLPQRWFTETVSIAILSTLVLCGAQVAGWSEVCSRAGSAVSCGPEQVEKERSLLKQDALNGHVIWWRFELSSCGLRYCDLQFNAVPVYLGLEPRSERRLLLSAGGEGGKGGLALCRWKLNSF